MRACVCMFNCDEETSKGRPRPQLCCCDTKEERNARTVHWYCMENCQAVMVM